MQLGGGGGGKGQLRFNYKVCGAILLVAGELKDGSVRRRQSPLFSGFQVA